MDDSNPFDTLREIDRRSRDDHFALLEEEDAIKALEKQIEAANKENQEWQSYIQDLKLETASLHAKEKSHREETSRIRIRVDNELQPEIRRLTKKLETLELRNAQILKSQEEKRQLMYRTYEEYKDDMCSKNPQYVRYLALQEEDRKLIQEVAEKERVVEEQEKYLKELKEKEIRKWNEFKSICIKAAENWKENEKKKEIEIERKKASLQIPASKNISALAQSKPWAFNVPWFLNMPFITGSTVTPTTNEHYYPMGAHSGNMNNGPYLSPSSYPFARRSEKYQLGKQKVGRTLEDLRLASAKCDEAMKRFREISLKPQQIPSPTKIARTSEPERLPEPPGFTASQAHLSSFMEKNIEPVTTSNETPANTPQVMTSSINYGNDTPPCSSTSTGTVVNAKDSIVSAASQPVENLREITHNNQTFVQPKVFPLGPAPAPQKSKSRISCAARTLQPLKKSFPEFRMATQKSDIASMNISAPSLPASQESVTSNCSIVANVGTQQAQASFPRPSSIGQSQESKKSSNNQADLESERTQAEPSILWDDVNVNGDFNEGGSSSFVFDGSSGFNFNFSTTASVDGDNESFSFGLDGEQSFF